MKARLLRLCDRLRDRLRGRAKCPHCADSGGAALLLPVGQSRDDASVPACPNCRRRPLVIEIAVVEPRSSQTPPGGN
jgi:hypothetical protein